MENNNDIIQRYLKKLNNATGMDNVRRNIKENKIYFDYNDKEYRLRMPKYGERKIIDKVKRETYLELIKSDTPLEIDLIKKLNKNNYITNIDRQISELNSDKERYQELLFKETHPDKEKEDEGRINELIAEIEKITYQQVTLAMQKQDKLGVCVEYQVLEKEIEIAIQLLFEVKTEEDWKRVYNTAEDMDNEEDRVILDNAAEMIKNLGVING